MNKVIISFILAFISFLAWESLGQEKSIPKKADKISNLDSKKIEIALSIDDEYLVENKLDTVQANSDNSPHFIKIIADIKEVGNSAPRYLHLFMKEDVDQDYYYQVSVDLVRGQCPMTIYPNVINKNYFVFAIANNRPRYPKKNDVFLLPSLPDPPIAAISFKRVK